MVFRIYFGKIMRARKQKQQFKIQEDAWMKNYSTTKKKKKSLLSRIWAQLKIYCECSTMHGLRYLGDPVLTLGEKFFWLIAFLLSLICASYFITTIFQKWNNSPVLISFSPFDADFNIIPFPAITICNMNQVKNIEAQRIMRNGTPVERALLDTYCNSSLTSDTSSDEKPATWKEIESFLKTSTPACEEMVKACLWESDSINCDDFFTQQLTDEGVCCSFNLLPPEQLFRDSSCISCSDSAGQKRDKKVYNWTAEEDFPEPNSGDLNVVPLRPVGAGTHLGLSVVLDVEREEYFCSSTSSVGFKIIFSNPTEMPMIENFGFLASPGLEYRFLITPEIRSCFNNVKDIEIEKRQCYFQDERPLFYYKAYTQNNCNLECISNYTYKFCECVPYYLPRTRNMTVCGKREEQCSIQAREDMQLWYGNGSSCLCLPSCYMLKYMESGSSSQLYTLNSKFGLQNITNNYFLENMVVATFFFDDVKYRKTYKSVTYGVVDALSSIGGLLGLCLGFSFMSLVEIAYFLFLRSFCVYANPKRRNNQTKVNFLN